MDLKTFLIHVKLGAVRLFWRLRFMVSAPSLPKNADGKVYLNLGCSDRTSKEFINIDAVPSRYTNYVQNIEDLSRFPDNSVDMVYASHVIEHIPRGKLLTVLREWHRVVKPGGVLRFGVPDFDAIIEMYLASGKDTHSVVRQLMGEDGEYDDHHSIWNLAYAEQVMKDAGFSSVRPWDPKTANHHDFKDKTMRAYQIDGRSIPFSLNLEAVK